MWIAFILIQRQITLWFWLCTSLQSNILQTVHQEVHSIMYSISKSSFKLIKPVEIYKADLLTHDHSWPGITLRPAKYLHDHAHTLSGRIGKVVSSHAEGCKIARPNPGGGWDAPIYTMHEVIWLYCPWGWAVPVNWIYSLWSHCPKLVVVDCN